MVGGGTDPVRSSRQSPCNTRPVIFFFFSSRRRHTRLQGDWSSDVCSSDLGDVYHWGALMAAALFTSIPLAIVYNLFIDRSEERRVGKECRSRWSPYH